MKKITNWSVIALLTLSSCAEEFNYDPTKEINENAQNIFGIIDPNQDWRTYTSGSVSITANADLDDIAKVQILTSSPFFNETAMVLAEADVTAGQTVTLNFNAPRGNETLIAACVDSKGHHYIKPFDTNTTQVSFASTTAKARSLTRADAGIDVSHLTLDADSTTWSINAARAIYSKIVTTANEPKSVKNLNDTKVNLWLDSNWENERVWQLSTTSSMSNGWNVVDGTVVRNIDAITAEESSTLKAIFDQWLTHKKNPDGTRIDNLTPIRTSSAVTLFNSHLTSDGLPITVIPVQMASTDLPKCDLFYYYYNPQAVPAGMSPADSANYVKQLPKFKAIPCEYTKAASGVSKVEDFFKVHEYLLPFYGDFTVEKATATPSGLYRIRNAGKTAVNHVDYLTYLGNDAYNSDKLAKAYTDNNANIANQLWQIYELGDDKCLFYNIGSKKFFTSTGKDYVNESNGWGTIFTDVPLFVKEEPFYVTDNGDGTKRIWRDNTRTQIVGANSANNPRIATNKSTSDGQFINWVFEEYTNTSGIDIPASIEIEADPVDHAAVSDCIPEGYQVGFMLRKALTPRSSSTRMGYMRAKNNGCTFGYGELNRCINNYPDHFSIAKTTYGMHDDDTRIAMFNANNKTYLAFEDGSDTNFSDLIIEVTGKSGKMFDDVQEVEDMPYTMCFEDRPQVADYDMNDVVLRCVRLSSNQLQLSLIATGAQDQVHIFGIDGSLVSGTDLNGKEVHEIFGVPTSTYVNTQPSSSVIASRSAVYQVSESTSIPQFLSKIYIKNISQGGNEIHVPKKGVPPYALIIPGDFDYPIEQTSIINAYTAFRQWANNAYNYGAWLDSYVASKIYTNPFNQ